MTGIIPAGGRESLCISGGESGKAELINIAQVDERVHYSYRTTAEDVFTVVRPNVDVEIEKALRTMLEVILEEDGQ